MELTDSFLTLLQNFAPVFTAPTYQTFVVIVTGWIISQRHRYVTEVIFSSGRVGDGHWSRFHRFFSHAAWDIDTFSLRLAKLVVTILAPGTTFFWAVNDTLCRKRGLTSRQESSGKEDSRSLKPFRWNPAGNQSRPVEPDQQPEASLAWWVGDHPCEA